MSLMKSLTEYVFWLLVVTEFVFGKASGLYYNGCFVE